MCGLEASGSIVHRSGERALDVAEELAFQQAFRQSPAVHADVGTRRSRTQVVDGPGDQFLACSSFTHDQDAGTRGCHLPGRPKNLPHGRAFTEDTGQAPSRRSGLAGPGRQRVRIKGGSSLDGHDRVTFKEAGSLVVRIRLDRGRLSMLLKVGVGGSAAEPGLRERRLLWVVEVVRLGSVASATSTGERQ